MPWIIGGVLLGLADLWIGSWAMWVWGKDPFPGVPIVVTMMVVFVVACIMVLMGEEDLRMS